MFLLSDNEKISQELKPTLPLDTPNDPVYIDIVDGHVIVPQLEFQKTTYEPKSSENASQSNVPQTVTATVSTCQDETYDDEDEDDNQVGKRFDWKISATRKLLTILVDKKKENSDFVFYQKKYGQKLQIILNRQQFIDHQQHNAEKSFIL